MGIAGLLFLTEGFGAAESKHDSLREAFNHGEVAIIEGVRRGGKHLDQADEIAFVDNRCSEDRSNL